MAWLSEENAAWHKWWYSPSLIILQALCSIVKNFVCTSTGKVLPSPWTFFRPRHTFLGRKNPTFDPCIKHTIVMTERIHTLFFVWNPLVKHYDLTYLDSNASRWMFNPQYRGAFELSKWVGFIQYLSLWGSVLDFICV